jgi:hypothetical protein
MQYNDFAMNNFVKEALKNLVRHHGEEIYSDINRLKDLLLRACPTCRKEIGVLSLAVQEGLVAELKTIGSINSESIRSLSIRLRDAAVGIDLNFAEWVIKAWVEVLDMEAQIQREQERIRAENERRERERRRAEEARREAERRERERREEQERIQRDQEQRQQEARRERERRETAQRERVQRAIREAREREAKKEEEFKSRRNKTIVGIGIAILAFIVLSPIIEKVSNLSKLRGQICTYRTNSYPADSLKVYNVGHGQDQKIRRDMFIADHDIFGSGRNSRTEHAIVNAGMTYTWNGGDASGYKFPNAPLPFREYFNLQKYDLKCQSSDIDPSVFNVPQNINFVTVTKDTFPTTHSAKKSSSRLANLKPTGITYNASKAIAGDTIYFDSGIRNVGKADTGVFNIKWFVDGRNVNAYGSHSGVPSGKTVMDGNSQFQWTFKNPGSHSVTFIVDVDNHIHESNEKDNSKTIKLSVR